MPGSVIFWVFLFIVLIVAIFALFPAVKKNWIEYSEKEKKPGTQITEQPAIDEPETPQPPRRDPPPQTQINEPPPRDEPPPQAPPEKPTENTLPPEQTPVSPKPEQPAIETRDRAVYFMQLDNDGNILFPIKVNRKLQVSSSPLRDSLEALLAGPTAEEQRRGLDTFLPARAKIQSIEIKGNTAEINFNADFQYNAFGREGIEAQLRQIVWTATEFPNVHNVQFLINGKKITYISEGISIENPIGRQ